MDAAKTWFRVVAVLMALLFVPCVLLQYNDPDPVRWMVMYGAAGVISIGLAWSTRREWVWAGLLAGGVAAAWGVLLLTGIWGKVAVSDVVLKMSEKGGAVEEEREFGGLLITAVWLLAATAYRSRRRR